MGRGMRLNGSRGIARITVPVLNARNLEEGWGYNFLSGYVFFFQAEDGIRDVAVTGVQTCALPISGMIKLPVAVLNHGNTVKFTEYSFLANVFAARGYMAVSIQHDLPTDAPMVTKAEIGRASCRERVYVSGVGGTCERKKHKARVGR